MQLNTKIYKIQCLPFPFSLDQNKNIFRFSVLESLPKTNKHIYMKIINGKSVIFSQRRTVAY